MVHYQWDEAKRQLNLEKHKLDFADAWLVYESEEKISLRSPFPDEPRRIDMAEVEGRVWLLVYVMRDREVRCISFRYAKRKERKIYYERQSTENG